MTNSKNEPAECVAIIGMRGRFPLARNVEQFWENLRDGIEAVSFFSDEEVLRAGVDPTLLADPSFVKAGGVLEDVDLFDAVFFGFSARDAEILDPQQRLFLECAWESLEDAGYDSEKYPGSIGVFAGTNMSTYLYNIYAEIARLGFIDNFQLMVSNDKDYVATLASYKLNLTGPSFTVQTACSTSLVAVCVACQNLLSYQCNIALAGGAAVNVPQRRGYYYQQGGILSPDGYCRTFDAAAQGTVGGNGVGIVVLKRLSEALADGDHIYAVIKGSALNNDGSLKVGFTAPSVEGQAQVIATAQNAAAVEPETIGYIEAHGTATPLGDPIEVSALTQAFGERTSQKNFCAIGSVKSNFGHLDSAAGVAGLIKTVLALQHKLIPPSLHFNQPNPEIDFENSPFYVNHRLSEWKSNGLPRRAGVSSFGIGGTNAHVVLEESPDIAPSGTSRFDPLLVLSAKTSTALEAATDDLVSHLRQYPDLSLADVAYTYQVGRRAFKHRRMLVCQSDVEDAAQALESRDPQRVVTAAQEFGDRPVIYGFPGQGSQYVDMGGDLYKAELTFRDSVDYCSEVLRPYLGLELRDVLYPSDEYYDEAKRLLRRTAITQPALFTVEYALARMWMEWGVLPQAMIGHSIGEYVAACISGVFTLEEALALVATRGQLMEMMPEGSMLAVQLPEADVLPLLNGKLSLAAINSPTQCVLSGPANAVGEIIEQLNTLGLPSTVLHTSHAFHSSMMEPIVSDFVGYVQRVNLEAPQIPFFSNVSGTWITVEEATDPAYWGRQLRQTVRFADGLQELLSYPEAILLEVGPGQTLGSLMRQQRRTTSEPLTLATLHPAQEPQPDIQFLIKTVGRLWLAGVNPDWSAMYRDERRLRLSLPTYHFERQSYWIGPPEDGAEAGATAPQIARDVANWLYVPTWTPSVPLELPAKPEPVRNCWLVFHDFGDPGAQLLERLENRGHEVISVVAGSQFEKLDSRSFRLCPDQRDGYDLLVKALQEEGALPEAIVHLWNVNVGESMPNVERFDRHQSLGFYSLLYLVQALTKANFTQEIPIGMVSSHLLSVLGDESLSPAKATVMGACKVIPQEYPSMRCRIIDISLHEEKDRPAEWLADRVIAELTVEPYSSAVAYRKGLRWVQDFESLKVSEAHESANTLREGGVYLITGGLGNIGLTLAEYLASKVRAKLVLLGRSAFPARDEWEQWLSTHGEDEVTRKIRKLRKLEELGAELMIARADASDIEEMRSVVDQIYKQFGDLNGVIHGAGNVGPGSDAAINQTDQAACDQHFAPKVKGLLVLEEVLRERNLDFCLLLSSLSSVLGGLGFVAYSAANNFMDAFARQQNQAKSQPWISVNWDGWQFPEDRSDHFSTELIRPVDGMAVFERVLLSGQTHVVVSVTDLRTRIDQWINLKFISTTAPVQSESQSATHARPNLGSQYVAPSTDAESEIVEIWQELLGVAPIGIHDNFFELGGHSLLAIQIVSRIRNSFQVELPVQQLFETPTVTQLAESIEKERVAFAPDDTSLAEVITMVEEISEEEARRLLAGPSA